jgi:hypothetical protein
VFFLLAFAFAFGFFFLFCMFGLAVMVYLWLAERNTREIEKDVVLLILSDQQASRVRRPVSNATSSPLRVNCESRVMDRKSPHHCPHCPHHHRNSHHCLHHHPNTQAPPPA